MVVNFRARGISRGAHKLTRTFTLIKNKKTLFQTFFSYFSQENEQTKRYKLKKKKSFFLMNFLYQDVLIELKLKYFASHLFYHCKSIINKQLSNGS
jgi:hypothetical protein